MSVGVESLSYRKTWKLSQAKWKNQAGRELKFCPQIHADFALYPNSWFCDLYRCQNRASQDFRSLMPMKFYLLSKNLICLKDLNSPKILPFLWLASLVDFLSNLSILSIDIRERLKFVPQLFYFHFSKSLNNLSSFERLNSFLSIGMFRIAEWVWLHA